MSKILNMSKIKIDKNVPLPTDLGKVRYPFADMKVGDSFEVDISKRESVITAASQFGRKYNPIRRFTTKKFNDDKIRVWRLA